MDPEQAEIRDASSRIFGNRYRAELLLALATATDGVCLGDLAAALGAPPSVYQGPVRALMNAGLVTREIKTPGDRRRWYRRSGDPKWWTQLRGVLEGLPGAAAAQAVG